MNRISYVMIMVICFGALAVARPKHYSGLTDPAQPFLVKPYVYTVKGETLAISWSYKDPHATVQKIVLNDNGRSLSLDANEADGVFTAILPVRTCGFGDLSFLIAGMTSAQKINELPCRDTTEATRFIMLADTQEGIAYDHEFDEQIKNFKTQAIVFGGDLVQEGSHPAEWPRFFDSVADVMGEEVTVPVVGNHEYKYDKTVPGWNRYFRTDASDAYYALDVGAAHLIILNSAFEDDRTLEAKELAWFKEEIKKPAAWKIVIFHHPPYSSSIMHTGVYPKREYIPLRRDFVPLFEQEGVQLVLNGHTHFYEHSLKNGVHYVTTGPAGGQMGLTGAINHYKINLERVRTMVQVETTQTRLNLTILGIDGRIVDQISLNRFEASGQSPIRWAGM